MLNLKYFYSFLRIKLLGRRPLNFAERHASLIERDALIVDFLGSTPKWICDVGANQGATSNALANCGHFILAFEMLNYEYKLASLRAHPRVGLFNQAITFETVNSLPKLDAILFLSVLHRIYAFQGEHKMKKIITAASLKCDEMFIEGSIRHERYIDGGGKAPGFSNLDSSSADLWHRNIFSECLGNRWKIVHQCYLECSASEPFRIFYYLKAV